MVRHIFVHMTVTDWWFVTPIDDEIVEDGLYLTLLNMHNDTQISRYCPQENAWANAFKQR